MNFAAFQIWRDEHLRSTPDLFDCAETNLYGALAPLRFDSGEVDDGRKIHRCDLARAWLQRYGFPENFSRRALVCRGVRHALGLIFKVLAENDSTLWLPRDVYPVYLELAADANIRPRLYQTLPQPEFPQATGGNGSEYLLIANPLKPLGRFLAPLECAGLMNWLQAAPDRHLLIDCVYDLGTPFHSTTMELMKTGRVVLFHSVTKGWLWPKTFGVALADGECAGWESAFRNDPPSQPQLRLAEKLLSLCPTLPARISKNLVMRKQGLLATLPAAVVNSMMIDPAAQAPGSYFVPVGMNTQELLRDHRILAIPSSAFGSDWDGSVLTSLAADLIPKSMEVDCEST